MVNTGRTLSCPFCRGSWDKIIGLGGEEGYAKERMVDIGKTIEEYNKELMVLADKYRPLLANTAELAKGGKVLEYYHRGHEGSLKTFTVDLKDATPPPPPPPPPAPRSLNTGPPVRENGFVHVPAGARGDGIPSQYRCMAVRPKGKTRCQMVVKWRYDGVTGVCQRHKDMIEKGNQVTLI